MPDKTDLAGEAKANIAIVSAYNDMLSAHQPYERFPELIKRAVREAAGAGAFGRKTLALAGVRVNLPRPWSV